MAKPEGPPSYLVKVMQCDVEALTFVLHIRRLREEVEYSEWPGLSLKLLADHKGAQALVKTLGEARYDDVLLDQVQGELLDISYWDFTEPIDLQGNLLGWDVEDTRSFYWKHKLRSKELWPRGMGKGDEWPSWADAPSSG